jgi:hypothetical protein
MLRASTAPTSSAAPAIVHDVLRSPGVPLDRATREAMEPRFGHSFAGVRVHADERAAASADAVGRSLTQREATWCSGQDATLRARVEGVGCSRTSWRT